MSRTIFLIWFAFLYFLFCLGSPAIGGDIYPILICELRVPKQASPNPKTTRISLATSSGEGSHYLWGYTQKIQKEDGQFFIFEPDDFVLSKESNKRRALIIEDYTNPAQFFSLSLPRNPKAKDWSPWQRPDFLSTGDVGWEFMYKQKIQGVITNIPDNCFELRYKVEMQRLGQ